VSETPLPADPVVDGPRTGAPTDSAQAAPDGEPAPAPEIEPAAQAVAEPDPAHGGEPVERAESVPAASFAGGGKLTEQAQRPAGPSLSFGFNLGKIAGHGEDSDPILRSGRELGLVGVFDGMGGAGGTVYETPDGPRTGAYLASRIARDVVEQRMLHLLDPEWHLDGPAVAEQLRIAVHDALAEHLRELKAPPSGLRSRLLRALPTTMALIALQRLQPDGDRWAAHLFWSGDSRVYVLSADAGLQQLTVDDIKDHGDAMANLREDSVVSNAMSADTEFVVNHRQVELTAPFLAIAATDGCFGYVPSPMHVEHLLLSPLQDVQSTQDWSTAVQAAISAVTGDDAAMSVLGIGADFRRFQTLLADRTTELEQRFIAPLDAADERVRQLERELDQARSQRQGRQAELWAAYKTGYARYLTASRTKEST
jgi:serine/threonine protein phosphatase PrpC